MSLRSILLILLSYPDPTPSWAIAAAADLARAHRAALEGILCVGSLPLVSNVLADRLVGANQIVADENARSQANSAVLADAFARAAGDDAPLRRISSRNVVDPLPVAELARLFDLTLVPVHGHPETISIAETLAFSSGRPVLLLPPPRPATSTTAVVGWDGGRPAARALADALPLLSAASAVEIIAITGDKALPENLPASAVVRHLARHGIVATSRSIPANGRDAGAALLGHAEAIGAGLLVMGAYGQSRLREFVLGGATRTVLGAPGLPVLLSH